MSAVRKEYFDKATIVRDTIRRHEIKNAKELLNVLVPANNIELRFFKHLQARIEMQQGNFKNALKILLQTKAQHKAHIELLIDIASCLYLSGEFAQWLIAVQELESVFFECQNTLNAETKNRALLNLAKFLEEKGELARALVIYCDRFAQLGIEQMRYKIIFAVQILRLQGQHRIQEDLPQIYSLILSLKNTPEAKNLFIEIEHGLILAELSLVGEVFSFARLKAALALDIPMRAKCLMYFDYIEALLIQKKSISMELVELRSSLNLGDLDPFEIILDKISRKEGLSLDIMNLNRLESSISPACKFRILYLLLQYNLFPEFNCELYRRLKLLLDNFTAKSVTIWKNRFLNFDTMSVLTVIELRPKTYSISVGATEISFKNKKIVFQILLLLAEKDVISLEEICKSLWSATYNLSYYDRIRILCSRINNHLSSIFSLPKILNFNDHSVQINPNIVIKNK